MTSTVDNCCQRAKVHRLVTWPEQSYKMSWSCCGFSQVFVLILSTWKFGFIIFLSVIQRIIIILSPIQLLIIFLSPIQRIIIFSKSNSAHHYFSKSNSAHHYLISSKCKQLLFFISKCKPALIFCSSRYETVSNCCIKTISYFFIISWIFDYVSNAISNYVQNF